MYNNLSGKTAYQYLVSGKVTFNHANVEDCNSNWVKLMSFSLKSGKPDYVSENTQGSEENMVERKKKQTESMYSDLPRQ